MNYDKRLTIRYEEIHYSTLGLRQNIQGRINIEGIQTWKKEWFSHLISERFAGLARQELVYSC